MSTVDRHSLSSSCPHTVWSKMLCLLQAPPLWAPLSLLATTTLIHALHGDHRDILHPTPSRVSYTLQKTGLVLSYLILLSPTQKAWIPRPTYSSISIPGMGSSTPRPSLDISVAQDREPPPPVNLLSSWGFCPLYTSSLRCKPQSHRNLSQFFPHDSPEPDTQ